MQNSSTALIDWMQLLRTICCARGRREGAARVRRSGHARRGRGARRVRCAGASGVRCAPRRAMRGGRARVCTSAGRVAVCAQRAGGAQGNGGRAHPEALALGLGVAVLVDHLHLLEDRRLARLARAEQQDLRHLHVFRHLLHLLLGELLRLQRGGRRLRRVSAAAAAAAATEHRRGNAVRAAPCLLVGLSAVACHNFARRYETAAVRNRALVRGSAGACARLVASRGALLSSHNIW